MSGLYAGITFNKGVPGAAASGTAATVSSGDPTAGAAATTNFQKEAAAYAAAQAEQAAKDQLEAQKKAALAFGPVVRRKPGLANKPKTAVISAAPSLIASAQSGNSSNTPSSSAPNNAASAPVVSSGHASVPPTGHVLTGRTLVVPPSMTLDSEDINGFKGTAAGKKAANKAKKRNKKNKNKEEDAALAWTAEYDPARPTDYVSGSFCIRMSLRVLDDGIDNSPLARMITRSTPKLPELNGKSNCGERRSDRSGSKPTMSQAREVNTQTRTITAMRREGGGSLTLTVSFVGQCPKNSLIVGSAEIRSSPCI